MPARKPVPIALLTTYLTDYRVPLYERLARAHDTEVLCYGGGARYAAPWFSDLDGQLERASFPARRLRGREEALAIGERYEMVIAPFAGGATLPAAYAGARRYGRPFVLWASVWAQPRSLTHAVALPLTRYIYRHSDAVVAYGTHVRRFVATLRGRDDDVFVAPQSVEPEVFRRPVSPDEQQAFRARHGLGGGPLALYVGRLTHEKGIGVLAHAWPQVSHADATLVVVGAGPLEDALRALPRTRVLGPLPRIELPDAYASAELTVVPSIPTPRFREPWGLVCNEAMHQGTVVVASGAVGAVAGGLVRDGESGWVVPPGDPAALSGAIDALLADAELRRRLGEGGRRAAEPYTYDAMLASFDAAIELARRRDASRRARPRRGR